MFYCFGYHNYALNYNHQCHKQYLEIKIHRNGLVFRNKKNGIEREGGRKRIKHGQEYCIAKSNMFNYQLPTNRDRIYNAELVPIGLPLDIWCPKQRLVYSNRKGYLRDHLTRSNSLLINSLSMPGPFSYVNPDFDFSEIL